MAKRPNLEDSSDEALFGGSTSEEEQRAGVESDMDAEDEEELEAVGRAASSGDDGAGEDGDSQATEDDVAKGSDDGDDEGENQMSDAEVAKREKARLREMQRLKKQKVQKILDAQNDAIDADMNNRGNGRLKYLLQQTEIFAHFAQGVQSANEKKPKGRRKKFTRNTLDLGLIIPSN